MIGTGPDPALWPRALRVTATVLALAASFLVGPARASSVLERSPAALFDAATRVVYGVVERVDVGEEDLLTVTLRVERDLGREPQDGADPLPSLRIAYGPLATDAVVADLPLPEPGDRVLWALAGDDGGVSPVIGMWQGAWTVQAEGLVDARGRILGVGDGVVRLGGSDRGTDAVLDALANALGGGEVRISDRLSSEDPVAGEEGTPLPPAPGAGGSDADGEDADDEAGESPAPYELVLSVPEATGLRSAVREAARIWTDAGFVLTVRFDEDAPDRVRVADPSELGADVAIVLLRAERRDGVDLVVRPGAAGRRADAWAQALARLLGLPPSPQGFAAGLLPPEGSIRPSAEDAAALARRVEARRGDLDGDGDVDLYDLAALAEAFGREGIALRADLDGSGVVDAIDLDLLRSGYEFLPASREPPATAR